MRRMLKHGSGRNWGVSHRSARVIERSKAGWGLIYGRKHVRPRRKFCRISSVTDAAKFVLVGAACVRGRLWPNAGAILSPMWLSTVVLVSTVWEGAGAG